MKTKPIEKPQIFQIQLTFQSGNIIMGIFPVREHPVKAISEMLRDASEKFENVLKISINNEEKYL
jgi:hypothetical protein